MIGDLAVKCELAKEVAQLGFVAVKAMSMELGYICVRYSPLEVVVSIPVGHRSVSLSFL